MTYWTSMLSALVIGMTILMAGTLMNREPKRSLRSVLVESLVWGGVFSLAFSAEITVLANP